MGLKSGTYQFYIDGDKCVQKQGNRVVVVGRVLKTKTKSKARQTLAQAEARLRMFNLESRLTESDATQHRP